MNEMMKLLYHGDVWLPRVNALQVVRYGVHFVESYRFLAFKSKIRRERKFPLVPKLHMVEEVIEQVQFESKLSTWVFNPIVESCSVDEDFIGRSAFLCRSVSPRSTCLRSLQRYLVQLMQVWSAD